VVQADIQSLNAATSENHVDGVKRAPAHQWTAFEDVRAPGWSPNGLVKLSDAGRNITPE
jgi:hypothetical protein